MAAATGDAGSIANGDVELPHTKEATEALIKAKEEE